jgi:broad specificity phosphatase PhoE
MELLLVRHAEVASDARGRCYGRLDVPLSEEGRMQARALGDLLAGEDLAAVVSSPRVRALDTARPIAARHGLPVTPLDELSELDFGELEGLTFDEIAVTWPDLYERWMTHPAAVVFPGGERFIELQQRAKEAVARLRDMYEGQIVVAVTHAGVVRAVVAAALRIPDERIFGLSVDIASISHVGWSQGGAAIVRSINVR